MRGNSVGDPILDLLTWRSAHGLMVKPMTNVKFDLVRQFLVNRAKILKGE